MSNQYFTSSRLPNPRGFNDPYRDVEHKTKIAALMSTEDYMYLQAVHAKVGTNQTTINILLSKLIELLKLYGITTYTDSDDYESLVANLVLSDGRRSPIEVVAVADGTPPTIAPTQDIGRNVGRGASHVNRVLANATNPVAVTPHGARRKKPTAPAPVARKTTPTAVKP